MFNFGALLISSEMLGKLFNLSELSHLLGQVGQ